MIGPIKNDQKRGDIIAHHNGNTNGWSISQIKGWEHRHSNNVPTTAEILELIGNDTCLIRMKPTGEIDWMSQSSFLSPYLPNTLHTRFNLLRWIAPGHAKFQKIHQDWIGWILGGGKSIRIWLCPPDHPEKMIPLEIELVNRNSIRKESKKYLYLLVKDLSNEWAMRSRLRANFRKAINKQKNLQEDFAILIHDWKASLSTIESSTWLCLRYQQETDQEKRQRHLKRIEKSIHELKVGIQDWELWNQPPTTRRWDTISIPHFIQERIEQITPMMKIGQKINFWHQGVEKLVTDPSSLQHIFDNLLSNAIKFSPEKSNIWIRFWNNGEQSRFEIIDEGIGIPKEDLSSLFNSRFRATNACSIPGNGLGLTIVDRLVKQLNGSIDVRSEPNKGTIFSITIKNQHIP